jgi:hypothetical protein
MSAESSNYSRVLLLYIRQLEPFLHRQTFALFLFFFFCRQWKCIRKSDCWDTARDFPLLTRSLSFSLYYIAYINAPSFSWGLVMSTAIQTRKTTKRYHTLHCCMYNILISGCQSLENNFKRKRGFSYIYTARLFMPREMIAIGRAYTRI